MRTAPSRWAAPLATYAWLITLLGGTFVLGLAGVGAPLRPLFVVGCAAVSYDAWRRGAAVHLQVAITLFCLAPFLRRVVDVHAGYDTTSVMLVGPMLAILIPTVELRALFRPDRPLDPALRPFLIVGGCIAYGGLISLIEGDLVSVASGLLKWVAPLLYGMWLFERARTDEAVLAGAVRAFLVVMPALGAYAVYQYVDPPMWDQYWMQSAPINSIGYPVPYQVRVFSMMNSPGSYATFTACGLLLIGFCRSGWISALLAAPCSLGLLLSMYRAAWIELVVAVLFCTLLAATRRRAVGLATGGAATVLVALTATPFGDAILARFDTFGDGSQDGSARERLQEFSTMLNADDGTLLGHGFVFVDGGKMGLLIDGQIISCWYTMGLVVGMICLAAILWAIGQGMSRTAGRRDPARVVLGAFMAGTLAQMPLAGIAAGETGFLFWSLAALAAAGTPLAEIRAPIGARNRALVAQRILQREGAEKAERQEPVAAAPAQ